MAEVDSITAKRLLLERMVEVSVRGTPFRLEVGAGANVKGVVDGFERLKRERNALARLSAAIETASWTRVVIRPFEVGELCPPVPVDVAGHAVLRRKNHVAKE